MKIRKGFVSNSSSSSFIINSNNFNIEEVKEIMEGIKSEMISEDSDTWFEYDVRIITPEIYKYDDWYMDSSDIGNIEVSSRDDNSIPGDAFDIIMETFDCGRRYLG